MEYGFILFILGISAALYILWIVIDIYLDGK